MQVVYARQPFPEAWTSCLFLAGPSPRSSAPVPSWRPAALRYLAARGYRGVVVLPEDASGESPFDYDAQVDWESEGLHLADVIVFWVPRELETLPGFTTNVEFGRWLDSLKCVLGRPAGAPKTRYLDLHYEAVMGSPPCSTLEQTLDEALARVGDGANRTGGERYVPLMLWRTPMLQAWNRELLRVGNRLERARLAWVFRSRQGELLASVLQAAVWVGSEGRLKANEWLLCRPDLCAVVLYHRPEGADPLDTALVLVREYRAPGRTPDGFVHELAGGSADGEPPAAAALRELEEETGMTVDGARLVPLGSRQVSAVLSSHHAHLFAVALTREELEGVQGARGGVAEEGERTAVELTTLREMLGSGLADWATLGMVCQALLR